ncbi:MAG: carnitine dehydratase [Alphaproteobacteria bacterium]|nr:carnitine dehydratase [Alphaproteobacteria bacterium]
MREKTMGPLQGIRIVEFAGLGPGPFCGMLLSDLGAEVIRIDRQQALAGRVDHDPRSQVMNRGRRSIAVDLKNPDACAAVLRLINQSDALIEGYRPGVMERLGLGPETCMAGNPRLIYGRMTGWGQDGPLAMAPGHDINYIALTGTLNAIGRRDAPPTPPLNLVGDFGGGAYLAMGLLAAILEAKTSGKGQIVDTAMVDAAASMMAYFFGFSASGYWSDERGSNYLDSGSPFYDTYETSDGKWIAIGSVEAKFWEQTWQLLGLDLADMPPQHDRGNWQDTKAKVTAAVKQKSRDEWTRIFDGQEACVAPVLSIPESASHPHIAARQTVVNFEGIEQPAPAPRFSRTSAELDLPPPARGEHSEAILRDWGFDAAEISALKESGAVMQA